MTDTDVLDSRYAWFRLGISLLVATVANVGMWSIIVVLPNIQAEFGVGRAEASVPYTLTMVGFAAGNFLLGNLVDRFGIARTLAGSVLLIGASTVGAALSPSIAILSMFQLFIGIGTAAGFGPLLADVSHWFLRRRGIAVSIAASGNYLSGAIWPVALSGVIEDFGWRTGYFVLAGMVVVIALPITLLLRTPVPDAAKARAEGIAAANRTRTSIGPGMLTLLLSIAAVACCVAMSMPQVHIVAYCTDLGYGAAVGSQMLSLMLLGGVASRLAAGMLSDRLGGVRTLLLSSTLQCTALFLFLPWDGLVPLYIVSLLFGLSQGGIVPSYAIVVREFLPAREAASKVGLVMMMTIIGMAIGGWMSGWIYDQTGSYQMAFLNGIAWNFLNIGIAATILLRSGRRSIQPA